MYEQTANQEQWTADGKEWTDRVEYRICLSITEISISTLLQFSGRQMKAL